MNDPFLRFKNRPKRLLCHLKVVKNTEHYNNAFVFSYNSFDIIWSCWSPWCLNSILREVSVFTAPGRFPFGGEKYWYIFFFWGGAEKIWLKFLGLVYCTVLLGSHFQQLRESFRSKGGCALMRRWYVQVSYWRDMSGTIIHWSRLWSLLDDWVTRFCLLSSGITDSSSDC